ncbi:MAG TPA: JAB domain-containing protein [Thermodesulfovibrionia bacterium]|nr:JAB domain-containing protein [Thermodesulfovibrionia bacterium]
MTYKIPTLKLSLVKESEIKTQTLSFKNSASVAEFMKKHLEDAHCEYFITLYLDNQHKFIGSYQISGTLNQTAVYPREIFSRALLSNAAAFILVHSHPSGILIPSAEDIRMTETLKKIGDMLQIKIIDHVIVSHEGYKSFQEMGLI